MEIKNIFREQLPSLRLIGKRYGENENFGKNWGEFWKNGWFTLLENAGGMAEFDYIGMKRIQSGRLEYWIGMFAPAGATVPDGFEFADISSIDYAVFWLYGNNNGDLLSFVSHNACLEKIKEKGWTRSEDNWCIERYNCPRFTVKDEFGNYIIDYYISIES